MQRINVTKLPIHHAVIQFIYESSLYFYFLSTIFIYLSSFFNFFFSFMNIYFSLSDIWFRNRKTAEGMRIQRSLYYRITPVRYPKAVYFIPSIPSTKYLFSRQSFRVKRALLAICWVHRYVQSIVYYTVD